MWLLDSVPKAIEEFSLDSATCGYCVITPEDCVGCELGGKDLCASGNGKAFLQVINFKYNNENIDNIDDAKRGARALLKAITQDCKQYDKV